MPSTDRLHHAARRSLASVVLAAVAITVNHLYSLGPRALLLGGLLVVLPTALLLWFRQTRNRVALAAYAAMNVWIVVGFGFYKGVWGGIMRLFMGTALASLSTSFPKPAVSRYGFEASGILMAVAAVFVAYYVIELIRAALASPIFMWARASIESSVRDWSGARPASGCARSRPNQVIASLGSHRRMAPKPRIHAARNRANVSPATSASSHACSSVANPSSTSPQ